MPTRSRQCAHTRLATCPQKEPDKYLLMFSVKSNWLVNISRWEILGRPRKLLLINGRTCSFHRCQAVSTMCQSWGTAVNRQKSCCRGERCASASGWPGRCVGVPEPQREWSEKWYVSKGLKEVRGTTMTISGAEAEGWPCQGRSGCVCRA